MERAKKKKLSPDDLLEQALVQYEKYPYEVPSNWRWVKFEWLIRETKLGLVRSTKDQDLNYTYKYLKMNNITNEGRIDLRDLINVEATDEEVEIYKLCKKDFLFNTRNSRELVGKNAVIKEGFLKPMLFNNNIMRVRFNDIIDPMIVSLYLNSPSGNIQLDQIKKVTTNIAAIYAKDLNKTAIPLPPLAEQQRIIERVESLFEKLDTAKKLVQNTLDSFENRKAAILHKAFTGELTAKWREKNGVSLDSWEEKKIGEVFDVFSGKGFKEKEYSTTGIKLLRITNVSYNNLEWKDTKYLPVEYAEKEKKLLLNKGDIVMALNRPITNNKLKVCAIDVDDSYILYQRVGCLRTKIEDINYKFALYFLQSDNFREQVEMNLQGSDQPYINIPPLKQLIMPLCSIKEQELIISILDNIIEQEQQAQELCDVIEKIDVMKKAILARAFRGELGTNNPDEESAENLLRETLEKTLS